MHLALLSMSSAAVCCGSRSRNIGVSWVALIFGFGLLLGLVAVPALAERGLLAEVTADPERVYLITSRSFFHPLVAGLLLTAVIAAVMSTADSQLLLASAIASGDVPLMKGLTRWPLDHPAGDPRLPDRDACGGAGHPS